VVERLHLLLNSSLLYMHHVHRGYERLLVAQFVGPLDADSMPGARVLYSESLNKTVSGATYRHLEWPAPVGLNDPELLVHRRETERLSM
jgi:hypothetical protein